MKVDEPMRKPEKLLFLRRMCREIVRPDFVVAELGCYYGESTQLFARNVAKVYAIDPWEEDYIDSDDLTERRKWKTETMSEVEAIFDKMAKDHPKIQKMKKRQEDAVHDFEDHSLDLVYCDTIHSEEATASAIDLWTPKVKKEGWMSGHDYCEEFPGVVCAVDARKNETFRLWGDGNWAYKPHG